MIGLCEVGPRDGLQNEATVLPLAQRVELIHRLAAAGLRQIEIGSFVNPRLVPAMAESDELVELLDVPKDVRLTALVLNLRGYERLARTRLEDVRFAFGATETFNQRNARAAVEDSLHEAAEIIRRAREDQRRVSVTIAVSFGCPFEGLVTPQRVVELAERIGSAGADELVLADTIGVATPSQVKSLVNAVDGTAAVLGVHLHNTRNTGYANALTAVDAGADLLDASVGGAGGCPFAPGATGNIATEDLVYILEREGLSTGLDLGAVADAARWLGTALGHELDGRFHRTPGWWPVVAGGEVHARAH
jgi:isopropylmalate/homocitrate/citramalate synthase